MPADAGSIYSEVRIRLDKLKADIASANTAFDQFGTEFVAKADKYSNATGKRYVAALQNISTSIKSVQSLVQQGALTEQEAVKKTLALRQQELKIIEARAVKEGTASAETIAAINNTKSAIGALQQSQELLSKSLSTDKQAAQLDVLNARIKATQALMQSGSLSEEEGIRATLALRQQKLRLLEKEASTSAVVTPAITKGLQEEQAAIVQLKARQEELHAAQEKQSQTFLTRLPKIASEVFYVIRSIRLVSSVIQGMIRPLQEAERAWEAQEEASQKVLSVFHSTGAAAWTTEGHILGLGESLAKVTKYSDEEIQAMEAVLLGFTQIQGVNFDKATEAILNVATIMKYDLTSSAQAVGKALEYPSKMLDGLRRQGFRFTDQQMAMIRSLEAAGKIEEAQKIILAELEKAYGGAARAVADTDAAIKIMMNKSFKDLGEQVGKAIAENGWVVALRRELKGMADDWLEVIKNHNAYNDLFKAKAAGAMTLEQQLMDAKDIVIAYEKVGKGQRDSLAVKYPAEYAKALQKVKDLEDKISGKGTTAGKGTTPTPRALEFETERNKIMQEYRDTLIAVNNQHLTDAEFNKAMGSAAEKQVQDLAKLSATYKEFWGPDNQALLDAAIDKQTTYNELIESDAAAAADAAAARTKAAQEEADAIQRVQDTDNARWKAATLGYLRLAAEAENASQAEIDAYNDAVAETNAIESEAQTERIERVARADALLNRLREANYERYALVVDKISGDMTTQQLDDFESIVAFEEDARSRSIDDIAAEAAASAEEETRRREAAAKEGIDAAQRVQDAENKRWLAATLGYLRVNKAASDAYDAEIAISAKAAEQDRIRRGQLRAEAVTDKEDRMQLALDEAEELRRNQAEVAAWEAAYLEKRNTNAQNADNERLARQYVAWQANQELIKEIVDDEYDHIVLTSSQATDKQIEDFKTLQLAVKVGSDEWNKLQAIIDKLNTDNAQDAFDNLVDKISTISGYIEDTIGAFTDIFNEGIQDQLDALEGYYDKQRELVENDGLTKEAALQKQIDDAVAAGDEEEEADARKQLALYKLEEEYNKKKLALQYESDMATWRNNVLQATVDLAMLVLNALKTPPAPNFLMAGLAGVAGGAQLAAVVSSEPSAPNAATGGVVLPRSGGSLVNVAENNQAELLLNDSAQGEAVLRSFADKINSGGIIEVTVYSMLDGQVVAENTVKRINDGKVRLKK